MSTLGNPSLCDPGTFDARKICDSLVCKLEALSFVRLTLSPIESELQGLRKQSICIEI